VVLQAEEEGRADLAELDAEDVLEVAADVLELELLARPRRQGGVEAGEGVLLAALLAAQRDAVEVGGDVLDPAHVAVAAARVLDAAVDGLERRELALAVLEEGALEVDAGGGDDVVAGAAQRARLG